MNWYNNRVILNVLAKDLKNAAEIYDAAEGHVLIGLLSANYKNVEEAVEDIKQFQLALDNHVSVGLGNGDPNQWIMVSNICSKVKVAHANQVFSAVGYTRANSN